ncbi:hypothetical protein SLA2020_315140 [Shorea laevis]
MAGPVIGFHPHRFFNPSDHCVVPLATQKAARVVSGRGRPLIVRFKLPPTFNITNFEASMNIHAPNTIDGKGKVVDAIAIGTSSMAAQAFRNTNTSPVLATPKPKRATGGARI